jgi:murein DD-endopeptidase MepM/ murein hydrolase activator NlpD
MKKWNTIIIVNSNGEIKKFKIYQKFFLFLIFSFIFIVALTFFLFSIEITHFIKFADLIKENLYLKYQLKEYSKIRGEIEDFRKIKNKLYIALGMDKVPIKDTNLITSDSIRLVEQIDTPAGMPTSGIITNKHSDEHIGIDIASEKNNVIYSTAVGKIIKVDSNQQFGLFIWILHNKNYKTFYAHLSKALVKEGDSVRRGQIIGFAGSSGYSTGPHLHYEVWKDGQALNPLDFK